MKKRTLLIIILCLALLLVFAAGCQQPKRKSKLAAKKPSEIVNRSAKSDIEALLNVTSVEEEEQAPSVDTSSMTSRCVAAIKQLELDIEEARETSKRLDNLLSNATDAYVKAQEDYDNAAKTGNPSRTSGANATLKRMQAEWEAAKDKANDGREDVKRLKLALVKAKDDCDPDYVPPVANTTPPPQASQCDSGKRDDLQDDYDAKKAEIDAKKDDLQELRDQLDDLENDLEDAQDANNTAEAENIQDDIDDKEEEIDDLKKEIADMEGDLDDKRVDLNKERVKCGLTSLSGSSNATGICDQYDENDVQDDLDEANKDLDELKDELDDLEDQRDAAEAANDDDEVDRLEDDIKDKQDDIDDKKDEIQELEDRLDALKDC